MKYRYEPQGVCPKQITFDLEGNVVRNIQFVGGCNGNLKMISKLLDGWTVEEIDAKLRGNLCGERGTSCADQLAQAVYKAYQRSQQDKQD